MTSIEAFKENNDGNCANVRSNDPLTANYSTKSIEKLMQEKENWRKEAVAYSEEVLRLQASVKVLQQAKDEQDLIIENLRKDEKVMNNRLSAITMEHREVKNHWLAEKADLSSRFHQVQALNTQIHGTLKKKEKDFDKLQLQLSKLVKDSNGRGTNSNKAVIMISVPLKKSFSQDNNNNTNNNNPTALALLKDMELNSLRQMMMTIQQENNSLKHLVEHLQRDLQELQSTCDEALTRQQQQDQHQLQQQQKPLAATIGGRRTSSIMTVPSSPGITVVAPPPSTNNTVAPTTASTTVALVATELTNSSAFVATAAKSPEVASSRVMSSVLSPLREEDNNKNNKLTPVPASKTVLAPLEIPSNTGTSNKTPVVLKSAFKSINESAATVMIHQPQAVPTTPGVRTVTWLVEQTNTEVKKLRTKVEMIAAGKSVPLLATKVSQQQESEVENHDEEDDDNNKFEEDSIDHYYHLRTMDSAGRIQTLKSRLTEALAVIQEQDKLIHDALLGHLPMHSRNNNMINDGSSANTLGGGGMIMKKQPEPIVWEVLEEEEEADNLAVLLANACSSVSSGFTTKRNSLNFDDLLKIQDADLLPPASPETFQLLEQYGWTLPTNSFQLPPAPPKSANKKGRFSFGGLAAASATLSLANNNGNNNSTKKANQQQQQQSVEKDTA